jgi:hypothetical protein
VACFFWWNRPRDGAKRFDHKLGHGAAWRPSRLLLGAPISRPASSVLGLPHVPADVPMPGMRTRSQTAVVGMCRPFRAHSFMCLVPRATLRSPWAVIRRPVGADPGQSPPSPAGSAGLPPGIFIPRTGLPPGIFIPCTGLLLGAPVSRSASSVLGLPHVPADVPIPRMRTRTQTAVVGMCRPFRAHSFMCLVPRASAA